MNAYMARLYYRNDGIFGKITIGDLTLFTCEHAYKNSQQEWKPKAPPGQYTCTRYLSPHFGYEVFQLQNVKGCQNIEIHRGNTEVDSHGCILLGIGLNIQVVGAVTQSAKAFDDFMNYLVGQDSFTLIIS